MNVLNQVAVDAMIEGYQLAMALKEQELKMGFNNAINALRAQEQLIYLNIRGCNSDPFH